MRLHLVDGTYELFRAHYSKRLEQPGQVVRAAAGRSGHHLRVRTAGTHYPRTAAARPAKTRMETNVRATTRPLHCYTPPGPSHVACQTTLEPLDPFRSLKQRVA